MIAGASEGLGAAFAEALAARGHDLILLARRAEPLEKLAITLRARHQGQVECHPVDLASFDPSVLLAGREFGVLVCNAAWSPLGEFLEQPLSGSEQAVDVNCRAPLRFLHALLPAMVERRAGAVILMSSLTAFQGSPFLSVYGATKAFNLSLAEGLWHELRPHGVDVLAVCAGATRTPNYLKAAAKGGAPGELEPSQVVQEALAALGSGPLLIPGSFNRFAALLMRFMPRRMTIALMGSQTRKLLLEAR